MPRRMLYFALLNEPTALRLCLGPAAPRIDGETTMAAKGNREMITLECTEAPGTSRYTTTKNKRKHPERLELRKYNRRLRKHTLHREKK